MGDVKQSTHGTVRGTASRQEKRLRKVRIAPTSNGGYVVTHHYHPNAGHGTPSTETHAFTDYAGAHAHLESLKH